MNSLELFLCYPEADERFHMECDAGRTVLANPQGLELTLIQITQTEFLIKWMGSGAAWPSSQSRTAGQPARRARHAQ